MGHTGSNFPRQFLVMGRRHLDYNWWLSGGQLISRGMVTIGRGSCTHRRKPMAPQAAGRCPQRGREMSVGRSLAAYSGQTPLRSFVQTPIFSVPPSSFSLQQT